MTYTVSSSTPATPMPSSMAPWRKRLFIAISHMTGDVAGYFGLPLDRTVIVGARIEI